MCHLLKLLGITGLSIMAALCLADRVDAVYLQPDCPSVSEAFDCGTWYSHPGAGDYIDRTWYYLLDDGQYRYLDKAQYNLMGGLSYVLGHPSYPKLFERGSEQAVGFTNRANTGLLASDGLQVPSIEHAVWYGRLNAGDYIDKIRYYYLDEGQYYYLDKGQYNLLGGLGYLFGRPSYLAPNAWDFHRLAEPRPFHAPEPSTIGFFGFGALAILALRRYNSGLMSQVG